MHNVKTLRRIKQNTHNLLYINIVQNYTYTDTHNIIVPINLSTLLSALLILLGPL
jgi:hypothetical protein